jgi:hypothetical protein
VFCLLVYIQLQPGISFVHLAAGPFTVGIRVTSTPTHRDERRALTHRVTRRVVGVQAGVQARREQTRSHRRSRQPIIFDFVFYRSILRTYSVDGHAGFAPAVRLFLPERRGNDDDGWGVGWSSTTRVSGRWVPTGFTKHKYNAKHKSIAKSNANAKHKSNAKHNANAIAERTRNASFASDVSSGTPLGGTFAMGASTPSSNRRTSRPAGTKNGKSASAERTFEVRIFQFSQLLYIHGKLQLGG